MLDLDHVRQRLGPDFQPFSVHLSNGCSFEVPHPEFIAVGRGFVIVIDNNNRSHKIEALHIRSIDDVTPDGHLNG